MGEVSQPFTPNPAGILWEADGACPLSQSLLGYILVEWDPGAESKFRELAAGNGLLF